MGSRKDLFFLKTLSALCLVGFICLSACATPPPPREGMPQAEITFAHLEPITIDVLELDNKVSYNITSPSISYFKPAPSKLFERYLNQRFKASGRGNGILEISVPNITILEHQAPTETKNYLWKENQTILTLNAKFNLLYVYGTNGVKKGSITASRSTLLHENMNIAQREKAAQNLIEKLILDADTELVKNVGLIITNIPQ